MSDDNNPISAGTLFDKVAPLLDCRGAGCGTDPNTVCLRCARTQLANYAANHGDRCDAEQTRLRAGWQAAAEATEKFRRTLLDLRSRILDDKGNGRSFAAMDRANLTALIEDALDGSDDYKVDLLAERDELKILLDASQGFEKSLEAALKSARSVATAIGIERDDAERVRDRLRADVSTLAADLETGAAIDERLTAFVSGAGAAAIAGSCLTRRELAAKLRRIIDRSERDTQVVSP